MRTITLHAFCSTKGGVGKSTLAVAWTELLRGEGRRCVLLDADLTGSSLADGLDLCAPDLRSDGQSGLSLGAAPSGAFLDAGETRSRIRERCRMRPKDVPLPRHVPFFNDALAYQGVVTEIECRLGAMLWRQGDESQGWLLPSSPSPNDVAVALGWLFQDGQADWQRRTAWILDALAEQLPDLTDVVLDLPPGLFGFVHAVLRLLAALRTGGPLPEGCPDLAGSGRAWETRPFLLMTPDRNAWASALRAFRRLRSTLPTLVPVVNRLSGGRVLLQGAVRSEFGATGIEERLRFLAESPDDLGRLFVDGRLTYLAPLRRAVGDALREDGA